MQLNRESSTWEEEAFIDIDKHESKELDTPFIRGTFTNGFSWTCCGQPGGRPGCQWSRHRAYDEDTGESNDNNDSDESKETYVSVKIDEDNVMVSIKIV